MAVPHSRPASPLRALVVTLSIFLSGCATQSYFGSVEMHAMLPLPAEHESALRRAVESVGYWQPHPIHQLHAYGWGEGRSVVFFTGPVRPSEHNAPIAADALEQPSALESRMKDLCEQRSREIAMALLRSGGVTTSTNVEVRAWCRGQLPEAPGKWQPAVAPFPFKYPTRTLHVECRLWIDTSTLSPDRLRLATPDDLKRVTSTEVRVTNFSPSEHNVEIGRVARSD